MQNIANSIFTYYPNNIDSSIKTFAQISITTLKTKIAKFSSNQTL